MTKEQNELRSLAEAKMQEVLDNEGDVEIDHINADNILTLLLSDLGYNKLVHLYNKIGKWYS